MSKKNENDRFGRDYTPCTGATGPIPPSSNKTFSGTDLYLAMVSIFLTSMIMRSSLIVVSTIHGMMLPDNLTWAMMGISGIVAGKICLAKDHTLLYKTRVCNSVISALQTVTVGPFTAVAQLGRSLSPGFSITRNLFD